jgi:hypothetical protein
LAVFFAHRGGKGNLGKKLSTATRAKISETLKGTKHSAATRAKFSERKKGKKLSVKHCAKIREE